MKAKQILAWSLPTAMFLAAGFFAVMKGPKWEHLTRNTLGAFVDYSTSTTG